MQHADAKFKIAADALPAPLPAGERVIWQGKPSARGLALRAFHIRAVAVYFGIVLAWRAGSGIATGTTFNDAMIGAAWLVVPASLSIAVLCALAWAFARSALYTVTNKRVVLQFGVALPMTLNIPLDKITNAALKSYSDGSGDIPLALSENKASYLLLWPHVRPWKLSAVQPMLRSVPDAASVSAKISEALCGQPEPMAIALQRHAATKHAAVTPVVAAAA